VPRFKLTIEYNGTRYSGWQIQENARTIQGELDRAVRTATDRKDFELYGSGRTDAGVHALGQVAHLDVGTSLSGHALLGRLNDHLPADINVLDAVVVPHRFHARHDAIGRRYLYQVATRRTAFAKPFVWWVKEPLVVDRMRGAAQVFVGMRDFQSFAAHDPQERSPQPRRQLTDRPRSTPSSHTRLARSVREQSTLVLIDRLDVATDGDLVLIVVEGSHFLWKMVRRIVGVLVEIGRGTLEPDAAGRLLTAKSDTPARLTAPASGLFLERVYYAGDERLKAITAATPLARRKP
jgi:tRNA pseudouridine38-40 synthase